MKKPTPQKAMAPTVSAVGAIRKNQKHLKFSAKSTATEAQRDRILQALRCRPQTSYDLRRLGCYQAPARVKELRDRFGYGITTDRVTLYDRDGFAHPRAALYTLVSETNGERPQ
ncbi:helix-turn-helix domain-containing protein [Polaromonas sp.]|uniref:helix-turn-helix domain-containing protein n=1 Tax=Polaromonas sp. TaxID=1869339 RepID=UPI002487C98E|nr:helix-turn-helix domain-containing protein [Polaromonas sp.]MDI1342418.1 helix-turn-helix domain-containing protein [Polaromonas sp.]